jgi:hypothetical protein
MDRRKRDRSRAARGREAAAPEIQRFIPENGRFVLVRK